MSQVSTKRLAQADLAIYAYMETSENEKPSSIDYLMSSRESAPSKLLDVPSLVVGFRPGTLSEKTPESIVWEASQEAIDFCIAARLDPPLLVGSLEILKTGLAKRANAR